MSDSKQRSRSPKSPREVPRPKSGTPQRPRSPPAPPPVLILADNLAPELKDVTTAILLAAKSINEATARLTEAAGSLQKACSNLTKTAAPVSAPPPAESEGWKSSWKESESKSGDGWTSPELFDKDDLVWIQAESEGQQEGWRCSKCNKWATSSHFWGKDHQTLLEKRKEQ